MIIPSGPVVWHTESRNRNSVTVVIRLNFTQSALNVALHVTENDIGHSVDFTLNDWKFSFFWIKMHSPGINDSLLV